MPKLPLAAALLCCALGGAASAQATKAERAAAANGKNVFMSIGCFTCHGTVGQGGAGARLAPNVLPLAAFRSWIRNGTPGWSVARGMPAFPESVLSERQIADVRAYLESLPPPPAVKNLPQLRP